MSGLNQARVQKVHATRFVISDRSLLSDLQHQQVTTTNHILWLLQVLLEKHQAQHLAIRR